MDFPHGAEAVRTVGSQLDQRPVGEDDIGRHALRLSQLRPQTFQGAELWGEIVRVPSRNDTERVELKFTRPLSDDVETAVSRLRELVKQDRRITRVAQIGVDTVNEGNYVLVVRVWVTREDAPQVHFDLNRAVKEEFQRRAPQPSLNHHHPRAHFQSNGTAVPPDWKSL
jgi:hypothetical protein